MIIIILREGSASCCAVLQGAARLVYSVFNQATVFHVDSLNPVLCTVLTSSDGANNAAEQGFQETATSSERKKYK